LAARQGLRRQRAIQRPLFQVAGLVSASVPVVVCVHFLSPFQLANGLLLAVVITACMLAALGLLLAVRPTQRRAAAVVLIAVSAFMLAGGCSQIPGVMRPVRERSLGVRNGCRARGPDYCSMEVLKYSLQCALLASYAWFTSYALWHLRPGISARLRLDAAWFAFSRSVFWNGLVLGTRALMLVVHPRAALEIEGEQAASLVAWVFAPMLLLGGLSGCKRLRLQAQAFLAKRGGEVSSAVCIAMLLNGLGADEVLAMAQSRFRCIAWSDVSLEAMLASAPDPSLRAKTRSVMLGECDGFISHRCSHALRRCSRLALP
jgi:hypothetical protein